MSSHRTVEGRAEAEIVGRKSRFIGQIAHVETEEEARFFLEEVRAAHRLARHNVYAYVLRTGGRVRYSDDGEPPRTAGLPTLETIQHAGLTDVAVVVTRYFGGVLLGTGGLVRAYTQATQAAVEAARVVEVARCVEVVAELPYSLYEQALRLAEECGAKVVDASFSDAVVLTARLLDGEQAGYVAALAELARGKADVIESDPFGAGM